MVFLITGGATDNAFLGTTFKTSLKTSRNPAPKKLDKDYNTPSMFSLLPEVHQGRRNGSST
jgi:hypothetical protein